MIFIYNETDSRYIVKRVTAPYTRREGNKIFIAPEEGDTLKVAYGFEVCSMVFDKGGTLQESNLIFEVYPDKYDMMDIHKIMVECAKLIDDYVEGRSEMSLDDIEGYYHL